MAGPVFAFPWQPAPIVAMTAYDDRQRCAEAGMDGYLEKPDRPQELFATVERMAAAAKR